MLMHVLTVCVGVCVDCVCWCVWTVCVDVCVDCVC